MVSDTQQGPIVRVVLLSIASLFMRGALSDERTGL
jgi:hypothetical protein